MEGNVWLALVAAFVGALFGGLGSALGTLGVNRLELVRSHRACPFLSARCALCSTAYTMGQRKDAGQALLVGPAGFEPATDRL